MQYYARQDQTLAEHIENTASLAKKFGRVFGFENMAYSAGLLHDFGKYTLEFQEYLGRSLRGDKVTRGEVIHALQGAKFAAETIKDYVISDILGNIVAGHHGGLFDNIIDGDRTLLSKTDKEEGKLHYKEALGVFYPGINESELALEILNFCKTCRRVKLSTPFMLHLMTKAVYSCLVDADRCDAARINPDDAPPNWGGLIHQAESYLVGLRHETPLEIVRKRISEQCQQSGNRPEGIFTLSVPTGGGKTLSSLRFALEHARKHNLKRIIYVIPYLSILDQTAVRLREIFKDDSDLILEHHSNIERSSDNDEEEQYRLLTSRWDSPIILTTMVQFLETIYSNKASLLRKFHNMSESVLIFDEIQSLPIKCVHLFNEAVNFLHCFGKSTALLCTATQPHLHRTDRPILLSDNPEIVNISPEDLKIFERVHIKDETGSVGDHEQIAGLARSQIEQGKSTLVILNTKSDACRVYEYSRSINCEKSFLSTDLCPAHRLEVLERLRKNLAPGTRRLTLCVSTQLIEAGVDISFDCVIRAQAGLDSIIQAAGRCNRNKENEGLQSVIVVNVKDEFLSRLPEIKDGKNVTARLFEEYKGMNLLSEEVIHSFYSYYFYQQKSKMDYAIEAGKTTVYSLLNDNPLAKTAYKNRHDYIYTGLPASFQTAADAFSVIDGGQTGVVVPYGKAMSLVNKFKETFDPKEKIMLLKCLQPYTVSVYSSCLDEIRQAVSIIDNTFYLLSPDYYDAEEYGLKRKAMGSLLNA